MHVAAESNRADLVGLLLEHGAQVDALDQLRDTPLHRASRKVARAACKALLDRGADVKRNGKDAWTCLRES